jgi:hypothetical protein
MIKMEGVNIYTTRKVVKHPKLYRKVMESSRSTGMEYRTEDRRKKRAQSITVKMASFIRTLVNHFR